MAKRLSKEEAIVRVIDKINLLKDAESADIEKYMNGYAALRNLEGQEREDAYNDISFALFGDKSEDTEEDIEEAIVEETIEDIQLPAVIETETALVATTTDDEPIEEPIPEDRPDQWLTMTDVLATATKEAAKAVAKAATVVAPVVAKTAVRTVAWSADRLVDLWYWLTTYAPIGARWLAVHLIWALADSIPVIVAGAKATGRAVRSAGLGVARGAMTVAGWVVVAALTTISISIRTAKVMADGWKLREEIIAEQAA